MLVITSCLGVVVAGSGVDDGYNAVGAARSAVIGDGVDDGA